MMPDPDIDAARRGDRAACSRLFAARWTMVRGFLRGVLGDPDVAEDLTQQTFLRAYTHMRQLRDPSRFDPWLRTIARSVFRNHLRRRPPVELCPVVRSDADPAMAAERDERRQRVRQALARLSRTDRVLVSLVVVEEKPLAEAARFLETPVTTVRRRLARAVVRLERLLAREGVHDAL